MIPPNLRKGDTVSIVAPAKNFRIADIEKGIEILREWGLKVQLSDNLLEQYHQFAGTDQQRADDLQKAVNSENIKAIFCARGGYGTVRIIDMVDFSQLSKHPKWIIGFSDITVIHSRLNRLGIAGLHAHVLTTMATASQESLSSLHSILFDDKLSLSQKGNEISQLNRFGSATAEVVGGNLSIICSLMGSDCEIDTTNKILFIEDIGENLYHIDRMIMCLKRAGKLDNLAGLIIGDMTDMEDNDIQFGKSAEEIIYDAVKDYYYPVCYNMPFGHIHNNMPIVIGGIFSLNIQKNNVFLQFINTADDTDKKTDAKNILKTTLWMLIFFVIALLLFKIINLI